MRQIENLIAARKSPLAPVICDDLPDDDLLAFALDLAGVKSTKAVVGHLITEFSDIEIILASPTEELRARGGLDSRAVAILKLLYAFRADNRRGQLLN